MLDKLGIEIHPGDIVAYTVYGKQLSIGKVISLEGRGGWRDCRIKVHGTWGSSDNPELNSKPGILQYADHIIVLEDVPKSYRRILEYVAIQ